VTKTEATEVDGSEARTVLVDVDRTLVDPLPRGHTSRPPPSLGGDDSPTMEPATKRRPRGPEPVAARPPTRLEELRDVLGEVAQRNQKVFWWLHTAYALGLGAFVATFAQKGFERARLLTLSLGVAWVLVVLFFRFFGTGRTQDFITAWPGARRRFFVMSYLMKNLFQGMLFFLLPFYYASSSYDAQTSGVFVLLGACAVLSTLDLVFDRVLLRFKLVASAFFAITLFGCANLVIPSLVPHTPVLLTLLVSAGLSAATFLLFHLPLEVLKKPLGIGAFLSIVSLGVGAVYLSREAFPAVPLFIADGGVGTGLRDDGTLTVEVRSVRLGSFDTLYAVTDVDLVGRGDSFVHVWRKDGALLAHQALEGSATGKRGRIRLASRLPVRALPKPALGRYTVDLATVSGQVVGRIDFDVKE